VSFVVEEGLCCGCGTCAGVCPTEAIAMNMTSQIFVPTIAMEKCTRCGVCVKSCPGHSVDFGSLNTQIFGNAPEALPIGNFLNCYVGYSTDHELRYNSASGGLATQLLTFALENDIIDGALVTRMNGQDPLEPEAFVARTVDDVISASKSKYSPVAANVALKEISRENGRFAVVGLPCHIHGIRKAEEASKVLRKRIVLRIGLLCSHMVAFAGIYNLLRKLKVEKDMVRSLTYRGNGWPGSLSVQLRNGRFERIPLTDGWRGYWSLFSPFFFTPVRCTMCPDQTAELADISLGDAWLPEFKSDKIGRSLVVCRTQVGQSVLEKATQSKVICLRQVDAEKVWQSQKANLKFKKADLSQRLSLLRMFGRATPRFTPKPHRKASFFSCLRNLFVYVNVYAASKTLLRFLWVHAPFPLFRLYYGIYKFLALV
jgi:coenzyme F420 hydrogenase subunit beta